jgi:hypothetical protein
LIFGASKRHCNWVVVVVAAVAAALIIMYHFL